MAVETPMVTKFMRERPDDSWQYETARAYNNAYTRIEKAFAMGSEAIVQEVQKSGLRGKGGAGFGAGQKWSFLPKDVFPRYLCVNGDEGEPATFKDHMIVERDPHQLVEGVIITAYAIQANHAFIYLRGEFGARRRATPGRDRRRVRARLPRHEHRGLGLRPRADPPPRRRLLHRGRRDGSAVEPRGRAGDAAHQAAVPGRAGSLRGAHGGQQRRDDLHRSRTSSSTAATGTRGWGSTSPPAPACSRCRATSSDPATTRSSWASRSATSSRASPAACATARR